MFIIYDEIHAEFVSDEFRTLDDAFSELQKIAVIPFGEEPNKPPCTSWKDCERKYYIHEYDDSELPWQFLGKAYALKLAASEVLWMFNDITSISWSTE